ncbi:9516_t:CDS:1, partial [Entrophospora sp. SA101]
QRGNQQKQETINTLRAEKQASQTQISQLTQELTTKTQTIADQLSQINEKDSQLAQQKAVLEQLLTNREQRLSQLGGEE